MAQKKPRRGFSAEDKERLVREALERKAHGSSWEVSATALGVSESMLRRWHKSGYGTRAAPKERKAPAERLSMEQKRELVQRVDAYRAEHGVTAEKAIEDSGGSVTLGNYYAFKAQLRKHEARMPVVQEFPLEAIPQRHPARERPAITVKGSRVNDEDRLIAATLLELAVRLLKR